MFHLTRDQANVMAYKHKEERDEKTNSWVTSIMKFKRIHTDFLNEY